jgi:hypothetical protein
MQLRSFFLLSTGLVLTLACSGEDEGNPGVHGGAGSGGSGGSANDGSAVVYEELSAYDWSLPAGEEQYYCVFTTLEEDLWISEFRPIQPAGTHHVTLGFIDPGPPDGVVEAGDPDAPFPCNGISLGDNLAYAAVRNTQGFTMPEGVAVKIPAGKQLLLSVHVFNLGDEVLEGRTGLEIVRSTPVDAEHQAEMIFAANLGIQVTPGASTQTSTCTMQADATILSLVHHMHLTGVHQKTTLVETNGERSILLDEPFVFEEQLFNVLDPPLHVAAGDQLEVECQFENPTDQTFTFGESTNQSEMCLTAFYRYPAVAESFICSL